MPENGPETKPEESKQGEKPSEAKPEAGAQPQGGRQYVDYDKLSSEDAAVMLKRIRARAKRIEKDIDEIMAILKYGANAGTPQGQNQGGGQGRRYQGGYRQGYRRNYYNKYGGKRYSQRRNDEDVNYE
jgi:hypothetical protein